MTEDTLGIPLVGDRQHRMNMANSSLFASSFLCTQTQCSLKNGDCTLGFSVHALQYSELVNYIHYLG
jgi:hypothetical protein